MQPLESDVDLFLHNVFAMIIGIISFIAQNIGMPLIDHVIVIFLGQ